MIQHDRLLDVLAYDSATGVFVWRKALSPVAQPGSRAGTLSPDGYRVIYVDRQRFQANRLAWFYMTGEWPAAEIDHRNRNRDDNRFENLREASPAQNSGNKSLYKNNRTGFKGVFQRKSGRYRAMLRHGGVLRHLGTYDDPHDAARAYNQAASACFGEFANLNILPAANEPNRETA